MARIEQNSPASPQKDLLRSQELYTREREAWRHVLGVEVDVKPLPEYVTSEVQRNLRHIGFALRYVPTLNLRSDSYLRERGVDTYLTELQQEYSKWKSLESLSYSERRDHTTPRNLEKKGYWEPVRDGIIAFPALPGQWMAVESVNKPSYREKYASTTFADDLGFSDDRFNASWNKVHTAIERKKHRVIEKLGLSGQPVDIRLLECLEYNLLGNREGWGKANTEELTNTESHLRDLPWRLTVGHHGNHDGVGGVNWVRPGISWRGVGFRATVILGTEHNEKRKQPLSPSNK